MRHILDHRTLVCSCGRTKEGHLELELLNERMRGRWADGMVNLEQDFAELEAALSHP